MGDTHNALLTTWTDIDHLPQPSSSNNIGKGNLVRVAIVGEGVAHVALDQFDRSQQGLQRGVVGVEG